MDKKLYTNVIVTTTINVPTELHAWLAAMNHHTDAMIIVGDLRTPHTEVDELLAKWREETGNANLRYIHPNEQTDWESSTAIGWNSDQRRNIGLLEAMKLAPAYITMTDDDNVPAVHKTSYFEKVNTLLETTDTTLPTHFPPQNLMPYFNSCVGAYHREIFPRGYPHEARPKMNDQYAYDVRDTVVDIGVHQAHWYGDPDIDAIDRISFRGRTFTPISDTRFVIAPLNTFCPINSQATTYRAELAPLMFVWPHTGRANDIWGGYFAKTILNHLGINVAFGAPNVRQNRDAFGVRNMQHHVRDLRLELGCYEYTSELVTILNDLPRLHPETTSILSYMQYALLYVSRRAIFLNHSTLHCFNAWITDVTTVMEGLKCEHS